MMKFSSGYLFALDSLFLRLRPQSSLLQYTRKAFILCSTRIMFLSIGKGGSFFNLLS
jgi:hypothetical protein